MAQRFGISTESITEQMGLRVNMQMAQKYGISMTNGTKRTALPGSAQLVWNGWNGGITISYTEQMGQLLCPITEK
jgi:hypothetical protein